MSDLPIRSGLFQDSPPMLIGSKCTVCGYACFPKKDVCVVCRRDDTMQESLFGPAATLDAFAVMQVAPPGFAAPYVQGYVKLKDGPKVFTLITDCETTEDGLKAGDEMELLIDKIKSDAAGNNLIGWKFRPARRPQ